MNVLYEEYCANITTKEVSKRNVRYSVLSAYVKSGNPQNILSFPQHKGHSVHLAYHCSAVNARQEARLQPSGISSENKRFVFHENGREGKLKQLITNRHCAIL